MSGSWQSAYRWGFGVVGSLSAISAVLFIDLGMASNLGGILVMTLLYSIWKNYKLTSFTELTENHAHAEALWIEANRPRVFLMPYFAGILPPLLRPATGDPQDALYRKLLSSRLLFGSVVMLIVTPALCFWLIHVLSDSVKHPPHNDIYTMPFVLTFIGIQGQFRNIRTELSTFKHYDRWVAQGCPKSVDLS
ncbi:MAG: hypothetical protein JST12_18815 [Armatimonadetes bacterium]|nr:hypothetical protein [Armatimonadota bacterium]